MGNDLNRIMFVSKKQHDWLFFRVHMCFWYPTLLPTVLYIPIWQHTSMPLRYLLTPMWAVIYCGGVPLQTDADMLWSLFWVIAGSWKIKPTYACHLWKRQWRSAVDEEMKEMKQWKINFKTCVVDSFSFSFIAMDGGPRGYTELLHIHINNA